MTTTVINLRDYERPARAVVIREVDADVIILPVVRVARVIADIVAKPPAPARRSLLGDL